MTVTIGYTTDDAFIAYALARGIVVTVPAAAVALTKAMDYMDTQHWQGDKTDPDQPLDWPRTGVQVNCSDIPSDTVPAGIVKAQHAVALSINAGFDPLSTIDRAVSKEKVDVLEIQYQADASDRAVIRSIDAAVKPYLWGNGCPGDGTSVYRVL